MIAPPRLVAAAGAVVAAALTAIAAAPAAAAPAPPPGAVDWVVGVRAGQSQARLAAALEAAGASVAPLPRLRALSVRGGPRARVAAAVDRAAGVAYVERRLVRRLHADPASAVDPATGRPYDWAITAVRAQPGIEAAGGGAPSSPVAVVDSGVDRDHPDLAGRVGPGHDVLGTGSVRDVVGHGTFVAALIAAVDGNGAGGRGVAGATPILPVRVSTGATLTSDALAAGIVAAVDAGARVVNVSIGGPGLSEVERAALDHAARRDVVVVASAGNSAQDGNPVEYPAAAVGGDSGGWSSGMSVGAVTPSGLPAPFSTHNRYVSIAAPGAGAGPCGEGVYSAIPDPASLWSGGPCDTVFEPPRHGPGRYAYGQGTSFSAPLVAGAAALVRQVRPGLRAEQVTHVLRRTAVQTLGSGWNERTGAGVLDVAAAVALAGRYDLVAPAVSVSARPLPDGVRVTAAAPDRTDPGDELAGGVTMTVERSADGQRFEPLAPAGPDAIDTTIVMAPGARLWLRATACDANRNCETRSAGPVAPAEEPPARATATTVARPRASILGAGARRCRSGRGRCLAVVWRAGPAALRGVRYEVAVRAAGARAPLARIRGAAAAARRQVMLLRPSRPLRCGRVRARLTVRAPGGARPVTRARWAHVRHGCRR